MKSLTRWHRINSRFEKRISDNAPTINIKGDFHYDLFSFMYYKTLRNIYKNRKANLRSK